MLPQSYVSLSKQCSFHQSSLSSLFAFAVVFPLHHLQFDEVLDTLTNHSKDKKKKVFIIHNENCDFYFLSSVTFTYLRNGSLEEQERLMEINALAGRF